jgi:dienelactone hydrolase
MQRLFELDVPGGRAPGIVTADDGASRSVVVIAPNGPLPLSGGNRIYVRIARRLAAEGHVVVRADLPGYGEAAGDVPAGSAGEHFRAIEEGRLVESYGCLLAAARSWFPELPLVAYGACGGGLTALLAVHGGAPADLVLASAIGVKRTAPARFATVTRTSGRGWRSNASILAAVPRLRLAPLLRRHPRLLFSGTDRWLNRPVVTAIDELLARGTGVGVVFGAHDAAAAQFERLVARPLALPRRRGFSRTLLPDVGHLLEDPGHVDLLAAALAERLSLPVPVPGQRRASRFSGGVAPAPRSRSPR